MRAYRIHSCSYEWVEKDAKVGSGAWNPSRLATCRYSVREPFERYSAHSASIGSASGTHP